LKGIGLLVAAIVILDHALSLQTISFRSKAYDVISLGLYQAIANEARTLGLTNVRVGGMVVRTGDQFLPAAAKRSG